MKFSASVRECQEMSAIFKSGNLYIREILLTVNFLITFFDLPRFLSYMQFIIYVYCIVLIQAGLLYLCNT